jgi:hypothetical protein
LAPAKSAFAAALFQRLSAREAICRLIGRKTKYGKQHSRHHLSHGNEIFAVGIITSHTFDTESTTATFTLSKNNREKRLAEFDYMVHEQFHANYTEYGIEFYFKLL